MQCSSIDIEEAILIKYFSCPSMKDQQWLNHKKLLLFGHKVNITEQSLRFYTAKVLSYRVIIKQMNLEQS
jgi:hypothetical protein